MRVPGASRLWLHLRETRPRRWIRDADEVIAGRALDLPAGKLRFALQRLVAVGTIEFEFVRVHKWFAFQFIMRKPEAKSI
jgi:hypothetical protein